MRDAPSPVILRKGDYTDIISSADFKPPAHFKAEEIGTAPKRFKFIIGIVLSLIKIHSKKEYRYRTGYGVLYENVTNVNINVTL